ncbi:MAG: hypothetical protein J1F63_05425 [Oscillospiraceae bacterium]|nr:hypothetical protein [Oscillospiraceae bacterium]
MQNKKRPTGAERLFSRMSDAEFAEEPLSEEDTEDKAETKDDDLPDADEEYAR